MSNKHTIVNRSAISSPAEDGNMENWFETDEGFNSIYPLPVRIQAQRHWTPVHVAKKAAAFLAVADNARILDIGSGAGKFCLVAAHEAPHALFYGVEQRQGLVRRAVKAKEQLQLKNVSFIHANITRVDLGDYDHFYFYNSFYENIDDTDRIDNSVDYTPELFDEYNRYLHRQLEQKPTGTRLVTFHCPGNELPASYKIVASEMNGLLQFRIKE